MNSLFILKNVDAYLSIYDLAVKNGKKPGDSMQSEFEEIRKLHPEWFQLIGNTVEDVDKLTGELREKGIKVLNPHEIDRQSERKNV